MRSIHITILLLTIITSAFTESKTFIDENFPYRIVCASTWEATEKSDSLFILQNNVSGSKTQLQLRKYPIDSSVTLEPMSWARISYAVNYKLADGVGEVLWGDTGNSAKLGDQRAFELFALYSQEVAEKTIWWAEYCRWTERNNYGYLVAIVGDTLELQTDLAKSNSNYKTIMDSVNILELAATYVTWNSSPPASVIGTSGSPAKAMYDLLGRKKIPHTQPFNALLVRKNEKVLLLQEMSNR